jgi:dipeptidyl aminopeptidase/acylaminoacyl peptidase
MDGAKSFGGRKNQDFMERDFEGIMSGVDYLIKAGLVDPSRMAWVATAMAA